MRSSNVRVNILVPHVTHVGLRRGKGDVRLTNGAYKFRFFGIYNLSRRRISNVSSYGAKVPFEDNFTGKSLLTNGAQARVFGMYAQAVFYLQEHTAQHGGTIFARAFRFCTLI